MALNWKQRIATKEKNEYIGEKVSVPVGNLKLTKKITIQNESNINYIQYQVARIDSQLNTITYYLDNYDNYSKDDYFENKLLVTVGWIPWTPSTHIYESLKSSGRIELINNDSIKNKLGYLFSFIIFIYYISWWRRCEMRHVYIK